jgi:sodium bicarbonate transporter 10
MVIGVATPKLIVPSNFAPTLPTRGWRVPPLNGNPVYTPVLAFVPAIFGSILIFMDQQITAVICNRKEHKLNKGGGYHLDLLLVAVCIIICSVLGIPWFVAATVLTINHVKSLHRESGCAAPGEKPRFLGIREQRVTHVLIFITVGLSVFMTPILSKIPMPVLYGVFLYMGVSSLDGLQFFDRILLFLMPKKFQPDTPYLRQVQLERVHLYTTIQIGCFAALWVVKSIPQTSILFPLMVSLLFGEEVRQVEGKVPREDFITKESLGQPECITWSIACLVTLLSNATADSYFQLVVIVFIRKLLDHVFTKKELQVLDDILPEFHRHDRLNDEEALQVRRATP